MDELGTHLFFVRAHSQRLQCVFVPVCELPVAKRNFLQRHGHGIVISSLQLKEEVDLFCLPIPRKSKRKRLSCNGVKLASSTKKCTATFPRNDTFEQLNQCYEDLNPREDAWLKLLRDRPQVHDQKGTEKWLEKVVAFSQETEPLSNDSLYEPLPFNPMAKSDEFHPVSPSNKSCSATIKLVPEISCHGFGFENTHWSAFGEAENVGTARDRATTPCDTSEFCKLVDGIEMSSIGVHMIW